MTEPCAGRHPPSWTLLITATVVVLAADLISKSVSFTHVAGQPVHVTRDNASMQGIIPDHPPINVVPHVLAFQLTLNTGAVFGLGQGAQWLFMLISVVAAAVITYVFWTSRAGAIGTHVALALILAGAIGNLHDRIRFNAVRDMLLLFPGVRLPFGWRWPGDSDLVYPWIFNIADVSLLAGVAIMFVVVARTSRPEPGAQTAHD